jgi:drug/metabolite transporter (DMT)-like permease
MRYPGYLYLIIIYIVWGSTYLAMRVGIAPGSGFPVFSFGAIRCLIAAVLLISIALLRPGFRLPNFKQTVQLAITGLAMWIGAHGLVLWSEQYVDSGFAAVAVSTAPLWVLLFNSLLDRVFPGLRHILFLLVGFAGVGALMFPELQKSQGNHLLSLLCLIVATINWSLSSVYLKRNPMLLSVFTSTGVQHLFGGIGFLVISLCLKEPIPSLSMASLGAMIYLVLFGSLLAYTAYIRVLQMLPTELVTTHTYVNPIIAVLLGWFILKEPVNNWTLIAIALVITSIAGILRNRKAVV